MTGCTWKMLSVCVDNGQFCNGLLYKAFEQIIPSDLRICAQLDRPSACITLLWHKQNWCPDMTDKRHSSVCLREALVCVCASHCNLTYVHWWSLALSVMQRLAQGHGRISQFTVFSPCLRVFLQTQSWLSCTMTHRCWRTITSPWVSNSCRRRTVTSSRTWPKNRDNRCARWS